MSIELFVRNVWVSGLYEQLLGQQDRCMKQSRVAQRNYMRTGEDWRARYFWRPCLRPCFLSIWCVRQERSLTPNFSRHQWTLYIAFILRVNRIRDHPWVTVSESNIRSVDWWLAHGSQSRRFRHNVPQGVFAAQSTHWREIYRYRARVYGWRLDASGYLRVHHLVSLVLRIVFYITNV